MAREKELILKRITPENPDVKLRPIEESTLKILRTMDKQFKEAIEKGEEYARTSREMLGGSKRSLRS